MHRDTNRYHPEDSPGDTPGIPEDTQAYLAAAPSYPEAHRREERRRRRPIRGRGGGKSGKRGRERPLYRVKEGENGDGNEGDLNVIRRRMERGSGLSQEGYSY